MVDNICMNENMFSEVYFADVTDVNIAKNIGLLPAIRQKKVNNYMFEQDKKLSIGAWLLLTKALAEHDIDVSKFEYAVDPSGKPILKKCPINFSISHSGKYVAVVISSSKVGIDIQEETTINQLVLTFMSNSDDISYYSSKENSLDAYFEIWTSKEATLKYRGIGITSSMKEIKIDYDNTYIFNDINNYIIAVVSDTPVVSMKELKIK